MNYGIIWQSMEHDITVKVIGHVYCQHVNKEHYVKFEWFWELSSWDHKDYDIIWQSQWSIKYRSMSLVMMYAESACQE